MVNVNLFWAKKYNISAFSFVFSIPPRLLGPTLGFLLGSFCLTTYVYPHEDPGFSEGDPRWIGAWWLGYPIIGSLILVFAGPLACFPQRLPKQGTDAHINQVNCLEK